MMATREEQLDMLEVMEMDEEELDQQLAEHGLTPPEPSLCIVLGRSTWDHLESHFAAVHVAREMGHMDVFELADIIEEIESTLREGRCS